MAVWAAGVELVLEELAAGDLLPGRIYLCGGGSRLPEIQTALEDDGFWRRLPFSRPPEVSVMTPSELEAISDRPACSWTSRTSRRWGSPTRRSSCRSIDDPLDVLAPARAPGDEGLTRR